MQRPDGDARTSAASVGVGVADSGSGRGSPTPTPTPTGIRSASARAFNVVLHLFLLSAALLTTGCRRKAAGENEPGAAVGPPPRVHCLPAETRLLHAQVVVHGTVAPLPDRDAQVAPQVAGRITRVLVREGERVSSGQPLARIDDAALADQARQAAAQLARAQAETGLARTTRARVDRVFQHGIAARQELDDAEARLATTQAGEAEVRATVEIANRQLDRATVRSPLGGVVLKLFRRSGELVDGTPATPIVEVGDPTRLELVATAIASDLVQVHAGDSATVEIAALPGSDLRGTVAAVSPAVDRGTGLGSIRVSLAAGAGPRPPVGVTGIARIEVGAPRRATLVPAAALRAALGDEGEVVLCGADRRAHVVRVAWSVIGIGLTELRARGDGGAAPLVAGTLVAVDPVLGLNEGDAIEPAP
jgi:RND family efflux transporter MFP subunit